MRVTAPHCPVLTLPSECIALNRPGFEEIIHLVVAVEAAGVWKSASSISKVCGKSAKKQFYQLRLSTAVLRMKREPIWLFWPRRRRV
jgi:hypothetical protein